MGNFWRLTEQEWLNCTAYPNELLGALGEKATSRQLRLFACAVVRRIWHLLEDRRSRYVVEEAERFADGNGSQDDLEDARRDAEEAAGSLTSDFKPDARHEAANAATAAGAPEPYLSSCPHDACNYAARAVADAAVQANADPHDDASPASENPDVLADAEYLEQIHLLRDIVGNPFQPQPTVNPTWVAWKDGTVRELAQACYDERMLPSGYLDPARLAVLADALVEAGCTDQDLLGHLRSSTTHVRGCWAVDAILNRK